jgi:large subunit ribosomal protein LX
MTKYAVKGNLRIGARTEKFTKHVDAKDEAEAKELTYSLFGSEHGTKRRFINIDKVEKAKEE